MRPTTDVLRDVGLAIAKLPSSAERSAKAAELLGKGGAKLGPIFADGAEGLDSLLGELDKLGGPLGDDPLDILGEAGDNMDRWDQATMMAKARLSAQFLPTLSTLVTKGTELIAVLTKATEGTNILKAALIVLGTAAAIAAVKMYAPYLPFAILLAIPILLVDDLITFFEGGGSAAERFLKALFGVVDGAAIARMTSPRPCSSIS